jgi:hypothetical protein
VTLHKTERTANKHSIAGGTISLLREVLSGFCFRFFLLTAVFLNFYPAYPQSPSQSCKSTVTGDLEIVPLTSKIYGNSRNLRIWLPPGYHDPANTQTTYSALYMFDGTWLFDRCTAPGTQGEWKIDETLTGLITQQQVEPIIVVGIDSNANRDVELAPFGNPLFYGGPKGASG